MSDRWLDIPTELGAALWRVLREDMGRRPIGTIHVHESFSDPDGFYGRPTMLTVIGPRGGASLMRLETTWTEENREDAVTRYWLPASQDGGSDV